MGLQCYKALWLQKYQPELRDEVPAPTEAIFELGHEVGALAQELFPGGVLIPYEGLSHSEQIAITQNALADRIETIYEATFRHDDVFIKVDILHLGTGGWDLYEVKSSADLKNQFLDDIAVQYYVASGAGLRLAKACLVHINTDYVRQGPIDVKQLFTIVDLTETIREMQPDVAAKLTRMRSMLQEKVPDIDIGPQCDDPYACGFHGHCWEHIPENSVFDFRDIGRPNAFDLYHNGIVRMEQVPAETLGWRQKLQKDGTLYQKNHVDKAAVKAFLDSLWYPLCFMDFETTCMAPIPLFDGMRPYGQLPFQFSLHMIEKEGKEPVHHSFLEKEMKNPCEEFLSNLLAVIPSGACILVWSQGFEKRFLREFAEMFPEKGGEIETILENIRDLMAPFRDKSIYHCKFDGSYSIKKVLPALMDGYSYENMAISNGEMASAAWVRMVQEHDLGEREKIYKELLEYCHLDTLAMIKILDAMMERIEAPC